ncbi:MAG: hypothetical protein R2710_26380 [Acidimicrobiales bacterium]
MSSEHLASSSLDECTIYLDLSPTEVLVHLQSEAFGPDNAHSDAQRWTMIVCPTPVFAGSRYGFWPVGDPIPRPVVVFLGREAMARAAVTPPTPHGAPDGVTIPYVTQMPTWWWLDDTDWRTATGTASLGQPTPASVTAVLTPIESTWQVGDHSVTCAQGLPWQESLSDDDPQRCGLTLETISGPEGVEQIVSISYEVSFICSPAVLCDQLPTFEPIVVSATSTVEVIRSES